MAFFINSPKLSEELLYLLILKYSKALKNNQNFNCVSYIGQVLCFTVLHYFLPLDHQQSFRTRKKLLQIFDPELQKKMLS